MPTSSKTSGNLLEQEYIAPEAHSLYKAFCLGMRHQSKTPYWTQKLETNQLGSLQKKILDKESIGGLTDFDEVIYKGNETFFTEIKLCASASIFCL